MLFSNWIIGRKSHKSNVNPSHMAYDRNLRTSLPFAFRFLLVRRVWTNGCEQIAEVAHYFEIPVISFIVVVVMGYGCICVAAVRTMHAQAKIDDVNCIRKHIKSVCVEFICFSCGRAGGRRWWSSFLRRFSSLVSNAKRATAWSGCHKFEKTFRILMRTKKRISLWS